MSGTFAIQSMLFQMILVYLLLTALSKLVQQDYDWNGTKLSLYIVFDFF